MLGDAGVHGAIECGFAGLATSQNKEPKMKRIQRSIVTAASLTAISLLASACATGVQMSQTPRMSTGAFRVDSRTAVYAPLAPGVTRSVVWGNPDAGPHGAFVRFVPGEMNNQLHFHTNDIRIVVLEGAYVYRPENGPEQRVTAGQFLFLPGGSRHVSGGDATRGALFYHESPGRFDLIPVQ